MRLRGSYLLPFAQAALVELTTALPLAPQQAAIYRVRGQVQVALNDLAAALTDLQRSLRLETNPTLRAISWREIGLLKQRDKAYLLEANKLAKEDFEEALRLNPLDPDSRWGLAHALVLMDDHAAAAVELEKADAVTKQVVAKYGPQVWALFFNPTTTYAQAYAKAVVDPKLSAERREELATKYVTRAIELLTQAQRAAGPKFAANFLKELRGDTPLNPIRQRPEFLEARKSLSSATKP